MKPLLCLALLSVSTAVLEGSILTFEDLPAGECGAISPPFSEANYSFNYPHGIGPGQAIACINVANGAGNSSRFSSNGTQTLGFASGSNSNVGTLTMTAKNGSAFDLNSVDLAQFYDSSDSAFPGNATGVEVVGILQGGGTVSDLLSITVVSDGPGGKADFATFQMPTSFDDLNSVSFTGVGGNSTNGNNFMMDNINVTTFSSVPEPSMLLPLAGILALALVRVRLSCNPGRRLE